MWVPTRPGRRSVPCGLTVRRMEVREVEHREVPTAPQPSPEQLELEAKWEQVGRLREEVVEHERALLTYLSNLQAFEHDHLLRCGRRYFELDSLVAEIAELLAERMPEDEALQAQATAARARARKLLDEAREREAQGPAEQVEITDELKSLYRRAARLFHPDLATSEAEQGARHDFMIELNAAYKRGDADRVQELIDDWQVCTGPPRDKSIAELLIDAIRIIANLERRIEKLERKRAEAERTEMGLLYRDYLAARDEGRDLIAEFLERLDEQIDRARQRLEELRNT